MNDLIKNLKSNPKARKNLIAALAALDEQVTYTNEDWDRRSHLASVLRDIESGFSGGNDTLMEKGLVWDGYCYSSPRSAAA